MHIDFKKVFKIGFGGGAAALALVLSVSAHAANETVDGNLTVTENTTVYGDVVAGDDVVAGADGGGNIYVIDGGISFLHDNGDGAYRDNGVALGAGAVMHISRYPVGGYINGVVIGSGAEGYQNSVVIGGNAYADDGAIAIGGNSEAYGSNAIILGGSLQLSTTVDNIFMGNNIINVKSDDTMVFGNYFDGQNAGGTVDGSVYFTNYATTQSSVFDLGGRYLTGYKIADPVNDMDIATKKYVDDVFASATNTGSSGGVDQEYVDNADSDTYDRAVETAYNRSVDYTRSVTSSMDSRIEANSARIGALEDKVSTIEDEIDDTTALALALTNPVIEPGKKSAVSVGVGGYGSSVAMGIAYAGRLKDDSFFVLGTSFTKNRVGVKGSLNVSF